MPAPWLVSSLLLLLLRYSISNQLLSSLLRSRLSSCNLASLPRTLAGAAVSLCWRLHLLLLLLLSQQLPQRHSC
jgi:hypothetical protein